MSSKTTVNKKKTLSKATNMVSEIGCVTSSIEDGNGRVRIFGRDYAAACDESVLRGRWVRVVGARGGVLAVRPLNVWLGSCCC